MKIFIKLLVLLASFGTYNTALSHPLDISTNYLSLSGENRIHMTTYLHPFEVGYLLRENNIENPDDIDTYFLHKNIIQEYVSNNISIQNDQRNCSLEGGVEVSRDEYYEILSDGLRVNYSFVCGKKINDFKVTIDFFKNFELQTNKLSVSRGLDDLYFKVLTAKVNSISIDINNIDTQVLDSDGDGISDEEELLYQTDKNNIDSDGDEFSDKEEIDNGWNPLNAEVSPGQDLENYREPGYLQKVYEKQNGASQEKGLNDNSQFIGGEYLKEVLKKISDYLKYNDGNFFTVFFMVFILGVIHAIGPGHSKSLLISYILEKEKKIYDGIAYSGVFSLIHILDILLLYVLFLVSSQFIDYSNLTGNIQFYSGIILILLAVYLFITKVIKRKTCNQSEKSGLLTAAIAGLMPCSFGWSIFLLLFSIGESAWIFPLILALGLGIFATLVSISIGAILLKDRLYTKLETLSNYGLIFSILIILSVGIFMIIK